MKGLVGAAVFAVMPLAPAAGGPGAMGALSAQSSDAARRGGVAADPESIQLPADVARVLRDYERAWEARDADALAALFTEDGFALRPGSPPARGRAAIRETYLNSGGPLVLRPYHFAAEGDVGWVIGGFARTADEPAVGKFVLAIERDASGRWLIAADIDNGN